MSLAEAASAASLAAAVPAAEAAKPSAALFVARSLHWLTAVLVALMFASGVLMTQIRTGPIADLMMSAHKLAGVLIFGLIVLRLGYRIWARLAGKWPPVMGGRFVHRLLYGLALAVPLLGWAGVSDFGARTALFGIELPAIWPQGLGYADTLFAAHAWLAFGLIALVVVHVGIALQDYVMRGSPSR